MQHSAPTLAFFIAAALPSLAAAAPLPKLVDTDVATDVDGAERIMTAYGYGDDGSLLVAEQLTYNTETKAVTFDVAYLDGARWQTLHGHGIAGEVLRWDDGVDPAPFLARNDELLDLAAETEVSEGPGKCFIGVVASTGACGGLAGIPGAGWFICATTIAATTCECFEDELGGC